MKQRPAIKGDLIEAQESTRSLATDPDASPAHESGLKTPTQEPDRSAGTAPASKRRWAEFAVPATAIGLAIGIAVLFTFNWGRWEGAAVMQTTNNAYLQADLTPLATRVSGYVREVAVTDFQRVAAGDLLVRIEDADYRVKVDQAEADVEAAIASIANFASQKALQETLVRQAQAAIAATESDVWRYRRDSERYQILLRRDAVSQQAAEQAMNSYRRAEATLDLNRAQLDQQRRQLDVLDTQTRQAEATVKARRAALHAARIDLGHTRIIAPVAGMVGQRQVRPGQYVGIGTQVVAVVPLPNVWVIANYKETQMTRMRVGQPARITVDAFRGAVLSGRVGGWSPATGSQFSLLPPDNATGNFTKVVQRVPVKIVLEPDASLDAYLRPGMSVIATIDTTAEPAQSGRAASDPAP